MSEPSNKTVSPKINVPIFGMANMGNTCYFNSLLQCIFSCTYLMAYIIDELKPKNEVQRYFKNTFLELIELFNNEDRETFNQVVVAFSAKLLSLLLQNKPNFNIHDQQSCSEFFLILIEELGVQHFFKIKHDIVIECDNCKNISTKQDENYHFEMFCDSMQQEQKQINVSIDQFITTTYFVDDYRCDHCKHRGKAKYTSKASTISQYLVILLNKYFFKNLVVYPSTFKLPVRQSKEEPESKVCVWRNIAQVEHNGNLASGHYTALCNRLNKVFSFDDMRTSMAPIDKLVPTKYTYMVFYEKM
jgi:ubiquitin C-terminal hydrolase